MSSDRDVQKRNNPQQESDLPGTDEDISVAATIVELWQKSAKIKLVAIDYDLTLIDFHSRGSWMYDSAERIVPRVRPCFRVLLDAAFQRSDMFVAIVTFSQQRDIILDLMKRLYPHRDLRRLIIQSFNMESSERKRLGKEIHLEKAIEEVKKNFNISLKPHEIILIDDTEANIKKAAANHYRVFHVRQGVTLDDIANHATQFSGKIKFPKHHERPRLPQQQQQVDKYKPGESTVGEDGKTETHF